MVTASKLFTDLEERVLVLVSVRVVVYVGRVVVHTWDLNIEHNSWVRVRVRVRGSCPYLGSEH